MPGDGANRERAQHSVLKPDRHIRMVPGVSATTRPLVERRVRRPDQRPLDPLDQLSVQVNVAAAPGLRV